jgi:ribosomal protein S18 acetylase RimI-like enzyme
VPKLDEPGVRELLAISVGFPTPEKMERVCSEYRSSTDRVLLGVVDEGGRLAGCIGLILGSGGSAVVKNISVRPDRRRKGVGRALLSEVIARFGIQALTAETDANAVEFYRRCGFSVESLGELYPGTERFRCTLSRNADERRPPDPPALQASEGGQTTT